MTIDDIFAALPEEPAQDAHEFLVIDPATRTIKVPASESIFGVEGDEDGERKYFISPRYVGDHLDLAACFLSIVYRNANGETDQYLVTDAAVNGEYVTFSWLLSEKVVKYKGVVQFRFDADTAAGPAWGTTMAQGTSLEGMEPEIEASTVEEETSDVVTQLRDMVTKQTGNVEAAGEAQVAAVKAQGTASTQEAMAAIQAQGAATNASIPAEYTELEATVDRLTRDRAAAIVCAAEGAAIQVQDASNDPLQGLRIFGKSTQDGTTTPDNPVEIVSTPAPVVGVYGKNLLKETEIPKTMTGSGITCDYEGGGVFHIHGTHTGEAQEVQLAGTGLYLPVDSAASYTLAVKLLEGKHPSKFHFFLGLGSNSVTFRNWFSVPLEQDADVGALLHDTRRPGDTLGDVNQITRFWIYNYNADLTAYTVDFRVQVWLEQGEAPTDYEPYTGQTMTITTPGSLPGIPVASGGNYTDANGQQWIADEVDLARGVYVQRAGNIVFDGSQSYHINAYQQGFGYYVFGCTKNGASYSEAPVLADKLNFKPWGYFTVDDIGDYICYEAYSFYISLADQSIQSVQAFQEYLTANPITAQYILAKPVETPLTDVELQAFLALHSNKPTTTVLNDAGAHMVLEYAADPKTFICNQIAAAIAAK